MNHSRELRDLTWAINSQSLLVESPLVQFDPSHVDPEHLRRFLEEEPSRRVGRYFERLVLYWLTHVREVEVIASSLQIRDGKRTLGEIDLVFRDECGRVTHWEIAVKFYLYLSSRTFSGSHYIGPNAGDTFERKMERLFDHQLPRSIKHFPEVEVRQPFVKGRMFYHVSEEHPVDLPDRHAPAHARCNWIRASELELLDLIEDARYRVLEKPHWLSGEEADMKDEGLLSYGEQREQLVRHFAVSERPVLLGQLKGTGECFGECERFFVVADGWPGESS